MPGEDGAFDARREFMDAGKDGEFADIAPDLAGGDHLVDLLEHFLRVRFGFAFDRFGEQRSGSFGDATAGTDKANVLNTVSIEREEEF